MARGLYSVEEGVEITAKDGDVGSGQSSLRGTGAPGGDADHQDAANPGSTYKRTNGEFFVKTTAGSGTDKWKRLANTDDINSLSFRSELVRASTGEALSAGVRDLTASPLTDDDGTKLDSSDFSVGEYILSGIGGTPKLFEVTVVSAPNITLVEEATNALAANDNFVSQNHLPDTPDDQEKESLLHYNGAAVIKIGDTNWEFLTGIALSGGYTPANGTVAAGDSGEVAIEKLDANQADLTTLSGEAQGAVDHDTFTGVTIQDNRNTHEALQDLETELETMATDVQSQAAGVTAEVTLDEVTVDDVLGAEWEVHMREDASPAKVKMEKITATHNGHSGADATDKDDSVHTKLMVGAGFSAVLSIDLDGAGASQKMRLRVSSGSAGVTFTARRTDITGP